MKPRNYNLGVVLPVFNGTHWVRRAISSVLREAEVTELVVVDDASTDDSVATILEMMAFDSRVKLIRHPSNLGVAVARNTGVREINSEFLSFIDQDDEWIEGSRLKLIQAISDSGEQGFAIGRQSFLLEESKHQTFKQLPSWVRSEWIRNSQLGWVFGAMVIPLGTFLKVGNTDSTRKFGTDDLDWFTRAFRLQVKHKKINSVVLTRGIHSNNFSADTRNSAEILQVIRIHLESQFLGQKRN